MKDEVLRCRTPLIESLDHGADRQFGHLGGVLPDRGEVEVGQPSDPAVVVADDGHLPGYHDAGAAVATVSQLFLDAGARVCRYTDQANPTSNGIYQAIGYQPVVDQVNLRIVGGATRSGS